MLLGITSALADPTAVDGISDRKIQINSAGLNEDPQTMIDNNISPTTGRNLLDLEIPDGFMGAAVTGEYKPMMVQISNASNGIGYSTSGTLYKLAPINGSYSDVVYEAPQEKNGNESRMSMIFSDLVPDYVGFVRSTRLTHVRIRQEWDCPLCTSGYSVADVPDEIKALGVKNPEGATPDDPGKIFVGDFPKVWKSYVWRLKGISDANSEIYQLAEIVNNVVPADYKAANHTFLFTDEVPEGGDDAEIVYVTFGNKYDTDSRLEYDADRNAYIRYVSFNKIEDQPYKDSKVVNPHKVQLTDSDGKKVTKIAVDDRYEDEEITFNNVIVQGIKMNWRDHVRPDPELTGTGNADYFMGGKHIAGVWERKEMASRTVFYGADGNEIQLQRGRTLIILMPYQQKNQSEKNWSVNENATVSYE